MTRAGRAAKHPAAGWLAALATAAVGAYQVHLEDGRARDDGSALVECAAEEADARARLELCLASREAHEDLEHGRAYPPAEDARSVVASGPEP